MNQYTVTFTMSTDDKLIPTDHNMEKLIDEALNDYMRQHGMSLKVSDLISKAKVDASWVRLNKT